MASPPTILPSHPRGSRNGRLRSALALGLLALVLAPILFLHFTAGREPARQAPAIDASSAPISDAANPTTPAAASLARTSVRGSPEGRTNQAVPPSEEAAPATPLDVTVVWNDGSPVASATVAITSAETVLASGSTDASGRLRFEAIDEPEAEVYVVQGALEVAHLPLPASGGDLRIEVPLRSAVRGMVRVDGVLPPEPVSLQLRTAPDSGTPRLTPPFVQRALGWRSRSGSVARTTTDDEGRFTFGNLPPGWSGELAPEDSDLFQSEGFPIVLDAPTAQLCVSLETCPSIRGRLLSPGGMPVTGCLIEIRENSEYGDSTFWGRTATNGRFLIPLQEEDARSATLEFSDARMGTRILETDLEAGRGADLGDIELNPSRTATFRVVDSDGTPIAGAIASRSQWKGPPSSTDGICVLGGLPLTRVTVRIDALGRRAKEVNLEAFAAGNPLDTAGSDPLEVVLERTATLLVSFVRPGGRALSGVELVLDGPGIFERKLGSLDRSQMNLGGGISQAVDFVEQPGGGRSLRVAFCSDESHPLLVTGLQPGVPIHLVARDTTRTLFPWEATLTLRPQEARRLEIVLEGELNTLRGVVLAENESPVTDATVSFRHPAANDVPTDSLGRFELGPLQTETIDLLVRAPGFALRYVPGVRTSEPQRILLERGRGQRISVVDAAGKLHRPDSVSAALGEFPIARGTEQTDGRFTFEHLPTGPVEILVRIGNRDFATPASEGPETVVAIPEPGRLTVRSDLDLPPGSTLNVRVSPIPRAFLGESRTFRPEELSAGQTTFAFLFPGTYEVEWGIQEQDGPRRVAASARVEILAGRTAEVSPREPREQE